ncbi:MAG: hypothetical protein JWQ21_3826 [Herminiimonas sp.]|nr:hypothetical protein [Herminiimonas sp.]
MKTDGKPFQVSTKKPVRKDAMPRMPHERDESEDSQSSAPRDDMKQAYRDITQGQVDTDLREQRGVEEAVKPHDATRNKATGNPADDAAGKSGR